MVMDNLSINFYPKTETLEDLGRGGLRLIQPRNKFRFGQDSVVLAYFAAINTTASKNLKVADLCAGSGVIGLLYAARCRQVPVLTVAVEHDPEMFSVLERNACLNARYNILPVHANLAEDVESWQVDQKHKVTPGDFKHSFQVVLVNPPYSHINKNKFIENDMARHEITGDLHAYLKAAVNLLRPLGQLFICFRPERLDELLLAAANLSLRATLIRPVQAFPDSKPKVFLAKFRWQGRANSLKWQPTLYTGDGHVKSYPTTDDGGIFSEFASIYTGGSCLKSEEMQQNIKVIDALI